MLAGNVNRNGRTPWRLAAAATGVLLALAAGSTLFLRNAGDDVASQRPASAQQPALSIELLQIQQLVRLESGVHGRRGQLLQVPCTLREGDGVQLQARLSRAAYCYWIAFEPDGDISLCFPANRDRPPPATRKPAHPWTEAERADTFFGFEDGRGWQAFVLVASEKPLPSFETWKEKRGPAPWRPAELATDATIVRHDGVRMEAFPLRASGLTRGAGSKTQIVDGGLAALVRWVKSDPRIVAVEGYSLPILPAD